jgi:hypothetical protein
MVAGEGAIENINRSNTKDVVRLYACAGFSDTTAAIVAGPVGDGAAGMIQAEE